jgi:hypothetical protein
MVTLRNADARAVDLLLDRAATAQGNGAMLFATEPGVSNEQIAAVEKVLNLLDVMPAAEPAPDLLRRTLDRIDVTVRPALSGHGHMLPADQPVA